MWFGGGFGLAGWRTVACLGWGATGMFSVCVLAGTFFRAAVPVFVFGRSLFALEVGGLVLLRCLDVFLFSPQPRGLSTGSIHWIVNN